MTFVICPLKSFQLVLSLITKRIVNWREITKDEESYIYDDNYHTICSIQVRFYISHLIFITFAFSSFQDRLTPDFSFPHLLVQDDISTLFLQPANDVNMLITTTLLWVCPIWRAAVLPINSQVLILFLIGKIITGFSHVLVCLIKVQSLSLLYGYHDISPNASSPTTIFA